MTNYYPDTCECVLTWKEPLKDNMSSIAFKAQCRTHKTVRETMNHNKTFQFEKTNETNDQLQDRKRLEKLKPAFRR